MHEVQGLARAEGRAEVRRGRSPLARLAGIVMGFPAAGKDVPLVVTFTEKDGVQTWTRDFNGAKFSTRLHAGRGRWDGLLVERFGPMAFAMAVLWRDGRINLHMRGWSFCGLPLPQFLCPRFVACETDENGVFSFNVEIYHPLTGLMVHYRGTLARMK